MPVYKETIEIDLKEGRNVLVVAHGNSLRAMTKYIEDIPDDDIPSYEIPTGIPIVYELDDNLDVVKKTIIEE